MKKPVILVAVLVIIMAIAGAVFVMMSPSEKPHEPKVLPPPEYLRVKSVTTNLRSREDEIHYIQIDIAIAVRDPEYIKKLEPYTPFIRSSLLGYFSDLYYEDISDPGYIEVIRMESLKLIRDIAEHHLKKQGVDDLLLTNIVIQ